MSAVLSAWGRLVADPAERQTKSGKSMTTARMAVEMCNGEDASNDCTLWLGLIAFGDHAEHLAKLAKGECLSVCGRLERNAWQDRNTGEQRIGWKLVVDSIVSARSSRPAGGRRKEQPS